MKLRIRNEIYVFATAETEETNAIIAGPGLPLRAALEF